MVNDAVVDRIRSVVKIKKMIVPSKHPWLSFSIYNIHAPSLSMFKPKPGIPDGVIKVREVAEISQPKRDCYAAVANSRTEIFMYSKLFCCNFSETLNSIKKSGCLKRFVMYIFVFNPPPPATK